MSILGDVERDVKKAAMLCEINPKTGQSIKVISTGYTNQRLSGYVFLCVDNIDLCREIAVANKNNQYINNNITAVKVLPSTLCLT